MYRWIQYIQAMEQTNIISKVFENSNIRQRESDGYLSATDMCKLFNREFKNYNKSQSTKEYINALSCVVPHGTTELVDIKQGGVPTEQGTWVHPQVATHLAMWISPKFAVKVTLWIEEWKQHSQANIEKYNYEINNLEPSRNMRIEAEVRDRLVCEYNGSSEIECASGIADIVTDKRVIEVKEYSKWKHALGQALAYGIDLGREPAVYLFVIIDDVSIEITSEQRAFIAPYFEKLGVTLL